MIATLANSIHSLTAEVSRIRQILGETGTQAREARRTSIRSTRVASSATKREVGGESEREEEEDEEVFYEAASLGRCA